MKYEKSCGAVIYKRDQFLEFLLVRQYGGHWSFPKGHVEEDESEYETALREIKEETNLEVIIKPNFRKVNTYSPVLGVMKDVIYFLATPHKGNLKKQDEEIQEIGFFSYVECLEKITFSNDIEILKEAKKTISERNL